MSSRVAGIAVVVAGLLAGSPLAASEAEPNARVDGLLGAYRAVTVAEWRLLGPGAAPVLERVARDPLALPTRRARALAALGAVEPTAAGPLIRELATDRTAPVVLRSAAVDAASSALGPAAQDLLVPLLHDREAVIRLRSARALGASGAAGCRALSAETKTLPPSDPVVRAAASCDAQLRARPPAEK